MQSTSTVTSSTMSAEVEVVRCACSNDEDERLMIQCESCCYWQHGMCIGVDEGSIPESHTCSACSSNSVQSNANVNANANASDSSISNSRFHRSPRLHRHRPMSVTQAGVVRFHGPTNSCCLGSNKPPVTNTPAPPVATNSAPQVDPIPSPPTRLLASVFSQ